jgi:hypothetical protein
VGWLAALALLVAAGVCVTVAIQPAPPAPVVFPPSVVFDAVHLNLGELEQNTTAPLQYQLTNHFNEPVQLLQATAGCSCIETKLSHKELQPGESATIDIKYQTGKQRGAVVGEVHFLFRNPDGLDVYHRLTYQATVKTDVKFAPGLEPWTIGTSGKQLIKVTSQEQGQHFKTELVFINHPAFAANVLSQNHGVIALELVYTADPTEQPSVTTRPIYLTINSNSSQEPSVIVPLKFVDSTNSASP